MPRPTAIAGHHAWRPGYERHRPEETVLYGVVQAALETFLARERERLRHRWRDGTTAVLFEPQQVLQRLVPLIPAPRAHLVRYHGVVAPCAGWRDRVVPTHAADRRSAPAPASTGGGPISRRYAWANLLSARPVKAFNPRSRPDSQVFAALMSGEHALHGFANRDLRDMLPASVLRLHDDPEKASAQVSRLLHRLHFHGLVAKIPRSRRWRVTAFGYTIMGTAVKLRQRDFPSLFRVAA